MSKRRIERFLPTAVQVLRDTGIAKDGRINRPFRNQIYGFGAAVATGSLLAVVGYFGDQGDADVDRSQLVGAIYQVLRKEAPRSLGNSEDLFEAVKGAGRGGQREIKEMILDAAVALKLAMNFFELTSEREEG